MIVVRREPLLIEINKCVAAFLNVGAEDFDTGPLWMDRPAQFFTNKPDVILLAR